jgi:hypothetical protein
MEFHFYTTYDNVNSLRNGIDINVWNKINARPQDIHISLNMNKYTLEQKGNGHYRVSLIK